MSANPLKDPKVRDAGIKESDLVFGRAVVPVPNQNKAPVKGKLGFEYMEHCFIGDSSKLTLANGQKVAASDHKFALPNGLNLTYGHINGLAGDFYGTYNPISDGTSDQDRSSRFVAAFNSLASDTMATRQPQEATAILAVLQAEVDAVNKALANHQDPSVAYSKLPDVSAKLESITFGRKDIPGYLGLSQINWDHFGIDARTAYNAGHAAAIQRAVNGDLEGAYAMNAFADHFLEDSFSAGHLRTPRRLLHKPDPDIFADGCAKFMHDEDCAIGFNVANPTGETWTCYGDKRGLDKEDAENLKRCVQAVQTSADEVYNAYKNKTIPSPADYGAWKLAPTLESARATTQSLATLFTFKNERRSIIGARRVWDFKSPADWNFWSTWILCDTSGLWTYPITLTNVQIASSRWTDISATRSRNGLHEVVYQAPNGSIFSTQHVDGSWKDPKLIAKAVRFTPLALVDWDSGNEAREFTFVLIVFAHEFPQQIRVFYLDDKYVLQEYCYSQRRGWYVGSIGSLNITAAYNSRPAAVYYGPGAHISVYLQEAGSLNIKEVRHENERWFRGEILPAALEGTSIAAVTYPQSGVLQTRVYFQKDDLSLVEYCHSSGRGWHQGAWSYGKHPGGTPIDAIAWTHDDGNSVIQVYWRDKDDQLIMSKNVNDWQPVDIVLSPGSLPSGFQFSVVEWDKGRNLRVYWQGIDHVMREHCSDNSGKNWFGGTLNLEAVESHK